MAPRGLGYSSFRPTGGSQLSGLGHSRQFGDVSVTSGLPPTPDMALHRTKRRYVPKGDIASEWKATPIEAGYIGGDASQVEILRRRIKDNEIEIDKSVGI